ncbi:MAG: hypothetical protein Q9163_000022 [Psora crenata]
MDPSPNQAGSVSLAPVHLPRITIRFCTQCRWMLRAAYFGQELLSTFPASLGEVSLIPTTGGVFTVDIVYAVSVSGEQQQVRTAQLWDRKSDGGFPETKRLKQLVRDIVDPRRDLGHVDAHHKPDVKPQTENEPSSQPDTVATVGTSSTQHGNTAEESNGKDNGIKNTAESEQQDARICEECE